MYKHLIGSPDKCVPDIKKTSCLGGGKKKKNKPGMTNWQSERSCFREKKKEVSHKTEARAGEVHQVRRGRYKLEIK